MAPQVPGLFYATKLQASLAWWKQPLNFASKKVVRYIEHGVKVEFKKGLPFAPKPSAPKFVDPQDVDFAIQDLIKGRRIGAYQDLAEGGEQFLSRSRVHTPPGKGKQRIVHTLCSLNEATVKHQTTYEDLRMLKSVVKPQDFMLSLDVESAYFHVPIHSKHRKFFSRHLALPLFVNNKFIELHATRRLFRLYQTRPRAIGVLVDQDMDKCHVSRSSSASPPWYEHSALCRRPLDRLQLLQGSFSGAPNHRGDASPRGYSPCTTQGLLRHTSADPA